MTPLEKVLIFAARELHQKTIRGLWDVDEYSLLDALDDVVKESKISQDDFDHSAVAIEL